jgi:hypothetical protein
MATTQINFFNSLYWDPFTGGVDALAQQDSGVQNNFVNPPFRLIGRVLEVVCAQKAVATIIAPNWTGQTWFKRLQKNDN